MGELYMTDKNGKMTKLGDVKSGVISYHTAVPESIAYLDMIKDMTSDDAEVTPKTNWWKVNDLRKLYGIKWYQWLWLWIKDFFYRLSKGIK